MRQTLLVTATLVVLLAGCGGNDAGSSVDGLDGDWVLSGSRPAIDAPADARIDLTIATDGTDTVVRGSAACNSYDGVVAVGGDGGWRSAGYARTEMGCDQPLLDAEQAYLDVLTTIDSWVLVDAEHLVLQGPDGELAFDAVAAPEPASFADTIWQLDGIIGVADGEATAVSSTRAGAPPVQLQFSDGGDLIVDDGCQSYFGSWDRDGGIVRTSPLSEADDDREPCTPDAQEASVAQGAEVLPLLDDAALDVSIDGDRLQLTTEDGGLAWRAVGVGGDG